MPDERPRKRIGSDGGIIQRSDGRAPFSSFRGRRPIRVAEENFPAMVRYMRRKLNWRSRHAYGGTLPPRPASDDRIPAMLSPGGWLPDAGPRFAEISPGERMICPECRVEVFVAAAVGRTDWHAEDCPRRGERP